MEKRSPLTIGRGIADICLQPSDVKAFPTGMSLLTFRPPCLGIASATTGHRKAKKALSLSVLSGMPRGTPLTLTAPIPDRCVIEIGLLRLCVSVWVCG